MMSQRLSNELRERISQEAGRVTATDVNWLTQEFRDYRHERRARTAEFQLGGANNTIGYVKPSKRRDNSLDLERTDDRGSVGGSGLHWMKYNTKLSVWTCQMLLRFAREPVHTQASFCEEDGQIFTSSMMFLNRHSKCGTALTVQ